MSMYVCNFVERERKSTLVFAINVAHVYGLARAFEKVTKISPKIITGKTDSYERSQILSDFAAGRIPVIINCGVLTEGTDLPRTDCVLLARPTCNSSLYIQMVGRGLRTHPDKRECLVLDVIDKMKSPKRSLITFPSLLEAQQKAKRGIDVVNYDDLLLATKEQEPEPKKPKDKRISEINFEVVKVTINKSKLTAINLESERLAWTNIPSYPIHLLECPEFRIILMEESKSSKDDDPDDLNDLYTAVVTAKKQEGEKGFNGFERVASHSYKLTIGKGMEIKSLLDEVDKFISNYERVNGVSLSSSLLRCAYWRRSFQPTAKQVSILMQGAKKFKASEVEIRAIFKSTKGQAANAITRINFLKNIKCPVQHAWTDIYN